MEKVFGRKFWALIIIELILLVTSNVFLERLGLIGVILSLAAIFLVGIIVTISSVNLSKFIVSKLKLTPPEEEELKREDDILLQATGFLQSGLFIYTIFFETTIDIDFVKALVVINGVAFYFVRALAKLKNSNKLRYISIFVFIFLLLIDTVIIIWMIKPVFLVSYYVSAIMNFLSIFGTIYLKHRYPKDQQENSSNKNQKEHLEPDKEASHPTVNKDSSRKILLLEYKELTEAIRHRGNQYLTLKSILVSGAVVSVAALIGTSNIEAMRSFIAKGTLVAAFSMIVISWIFHFSTSKLDKIYWRRVHDIEKQVGIQGHNKLYTEEIENKLWFKLRKKSWEIIHGMLTFMFLLGIFYAFSIIEFPFF